MQRLRKFLRLKTSHKLLLVRCVVQLALTRAGLALFGYKRVSASLERRLAKKTRPGDAREIIWGVRTAAQVLRGSKCLAQAVTLHFLLARSGYPSVIRVGVAKGDDVVFDAHAWVIFNNAIVIGEAGAVQRDYIPLTDLQLHGQ
jgi:hypothetical protein